MGKSASGKDTIYKELTSNQNLELKTIVPYTTRPIREGEEDGVEYHFCDMEKLDALEKAGKVIEERRYHTVHGVWCYFTVDDGQIELEKNDYILIGTLEVFKSLSRFYGSENVIPIYIEVEDGLRLSRALERERQQDHPKYEEMCRRFLADAKDFSEEELQNCGVEKRFDNRCMEETLHAIETYINQCKKSQ